MKQRELEIILQGLKGFDNPRASLEQYCTPAVIAADILYTAHGLGDIRDRRIVDLGCGTGIFAIGSCLLGAGEVWGMDIDQGAIDTAMENAESAECSVELRKCAVEEVAGEWDTCIMNPPFGSQARHADLPFLDRALEIAGVVYSLHNSGTLKFLRKRLEAAGYMLSMEKNYKFGIPHTFGFHRKENVKIDVTLLRTVKP